MFEGISREALERFIADNYKSSKVVKIDLQIKELELRFAEAWLSFIDYNTSNCWFYHMSEFKKEAEKRKEKALEINNRLNELRKIRKTLKKVKKRH